MSHKNTNTTWSFTGAEKAAADERREAAKARKAARARQMAEDDEEENDEGDLVSATNVS